MTPLEQYAAMLRQDTITIYPPANDWPFDPDNISEMWRQREEAKRQAQQQQQHEQIRILYPEAHGHVQRQSD
jgi:ADP-heptose:LPS heptosyltransferase